MGLRVDCDAHCESLWTKVSAKMQMSEVKFAKHQPRRSQPAAVRELKLQQRHRTGDTNNPRRVTMQELLLFYVLS